VSDEHELYYEESGNKDGKPIVVLHGGPGSGSFPWYRQLFDPQAYRIIMFDQRGAGKSKPHASLSDNTTWHLVEDMEKIREHLGVEKWVVFGGSWGSTLGLAYAESYPERVKALIVRGICVLRREEMLWFYQEGASWLFPEAWEHFLEPIPEAERGDLMNAYYRRLTGSDEQEQHRAAKAWTKWELSTFSLLSDPATIRLSEDDKLTLAVARIECHYFVNGGFFKKEGQLLSEAYKLANIPGVIVHGRYDVVCPVKTAWDLHSVWPSADFKIIPDAGHTMKEPGNLSALIEACDKFKTL